ncbi:MAG: UbiA family prenyltransferase, partial [bacterium]
MNFIMATPNNFIYIFLKLLNPLGFGGITTGIHAAAYLIITGLFLFIYRSTKKITQSIIGSIIAYIILFIYAISPSFLAISQLLKTGQTSAANAYQQTIENSWLWMQQATITPISISENINALEYFSDIPMAQLFFLTMSFQLFLLFIIYYPKLWLSMKTNLRPLRVIFWFFISGTGIFIAKNIYADLSFSNSINLLSMIVFMFLIALNIWLAVCINDAEDTEIDLLSNFNRPLIKNEFTISQWNKLTLFLLFLVIIGVSTMNTNVSFLFIVAQLSYYMYSSFPLRLKSNFVSSSLLIGIAAATISMAGFFLVSPDQHTLAFPASAILLIGLVVALISNFKDIKDFTGDSSAKIQTMPVFFGLEKSKKIIATFFTFIIIFLPYILKIKNMLFLSIILSVFILYL